MAKKKFPPLDVLDAKGRLVATLSEHVHTVLVFYYLNCSDSRGTSRAMVEAIKTVKEGYLGRGTYVDFRPGSVAGVFMLPAVISDLTNEISRAQEMYFEASESGRKVIHHVHLEGHGDVGLRKGVGERQCQRQMSPVNLQVLDQDSLVNCGMRGGKEIALAMDRIMLAKRPEFAYFYRGRKKRVKISDGKRLKELVHDLYGTSGTFPAILHSVQNLCTHAAEEKDKLRDAFDRNPEFSTALCPTITSSVFNYRTGRSYRTDGDASVHCFMDDVFRHMSEHGTLLQERELASSRQHPEIGLFFMGTQYPTETAFRLVSRSGKAYSAGKVFGVGVSTLGNPNKPIGPDKLGSFVFGAGRLGLKNWAVLCPTEEDLMRARAKLRNDIVASFFASRFGVTFIFLTPDGKRKSVKASKLAGTSALGMRFSQGRQPG